MTHHFKAFHLVNGKVEPCDILEIIGLCVNGDQLEILFKPGYVFGRQWMRLKELEKPFEFYHYETKYRILFTDQDLSPDEIKIKLVGNYL